MPNSPAKVIVMGASAGGVEALQKVVAALPLDLQAAVLIVLHLGRKSESFLANILARAGPLPAVLASDGEKLESARIYTAVPDYHLAVQDGFLRVLRGPTENRARPSIDVLFRSAAQWYRERAVGVLLTGSNDDGASGLLAIRRLGGTVIIQDPADALFSEMPRSALQYLEPDHILPLTEIGPLLASLAGKGLARKHMPKDLPEPPAESDPEKVGIPSGFTCPDCGGTLWELQEGELLRFRCRIGHSYSPKAMLDAESDEVERALWIAVRSLEESAAVNRRLASSGGTLHQQFADRAVERIRYAGIIRELLANGEFE